MSSIPVPNESVRPKRMLRNLLLDSRFQLKYTAIIVGVALAVSTVLGAFLWRTSRQVIHDAAVLADESKKVSTLSKLNLEKLGYEQNVIDELTTSLNEYDSKVEEQKRALVHQQNVMLGIVAGGLTLFVLLIGGFGIYVTHKVAGPIHKMKKLLRQVGDGKLAFGGRLRKGDELKDFFDEFATMVDNLRRRQQREIQELEKAIELARAGGVNNESLARVLSVRDEMQRALDD